MLRINELSLPAPIKPISPKDITALRQKLNVSQAVFAGLLNVPKVTASVGKKGAGGRPVPPSVCLT